MTLMDYLEFKNSTSAFNATQDEIGGTITFSNSGKRGSVKQFTLGLPSFIATLVNIRDNLSEFIDNKDYNEKAWRDLGSEYFTDGPANAMSTVQTKPLFSTLSKIITWANSPNLEDIDTDQYIQIDEKSIITSIQQLETLSKQFKSTKTPYKKDVSNSNSYSFNYLKFASNCDSCNLIVKKDLTLRLIGSLITKQFVILTGLSGSGKTKLAQAFAKWVCENDTQYKIIPVGADWTSREPLFGYPNALEQNKYILPDSGVLSLILEASKPENENKPYFLILDEMNLSHVERYFADFLSSMESGEAIPLHSGESDWDGIPPSIKLPKNLFIIGTVNIDETTYMFSPKVLDRANVIEFRVTEAEMRNYLSTSTELTLNHLAAKGVGMAASFVALATNKDLIPTNAKELNEELLKFFVELKRCGAEFGYRSASEINRFAAVVNKLEPDWSQAQIMDAAIMQKLLPKVHGSRKKLEPVLKKLGELCLHDATVFADYIKSGESIITPEKIKYPVSMEKIGRMYRALLENSFTSYAEA